MLHGLKVVLGFPAVFLLALVSLMASVRAMKKFGVSGLFQSEVEEMTEKEVKAFFEKHPHAMFHAEMCGVLFWVVLGMLVFHQSP